MRVVPEWADFLKVGCETTEYHKRKTQRVIGPEWAVQEQALEEEENSTCEPSERYKNGSLPILYDAHTVTP